MIFKKMYFSLLTCSINPATMCIGKGTCIVSHIKSREVINGYFHFMTPVKFFFGPSSESPIPLNSLKFPFAPADGWKTFSKVAQCTGHFINSNRATQLHKKVTLKCTTSGTFKKLSVLQKFPLIICNLPLISGNVLLLLLTPSPLHSQSYTTGFLTVYKIQEIKNEPFLVNVCKGVSGYNIPFTYVESIWNYKPNLR